MSPPRIGIDGYNLAMSRGTGIATYARVLSRCLAEMGHEVDVLYGLPMSPKASPAMREVAFFDRLEQEGRRRPAFGSRRWWRELSAAWRGCDAMEIPMTGLVDRRSFRMPAFDRILNAPDLFDLAGRHFRRHRRFLRVRAPNPPAIMHWTYPLPIVLEGARNIYTVHDLVPLRLPYTTLDNKRTHFRLHARLHARRGRRSAPCRRRRRGDILSLFPQAEGR